MSALAQVAVCACLSATTHHPALTQCLLTTCPLPLLHVHEHSCPQVGFGEDVRMVNADIASARMFTSFEAIGRHVAWFLDNPPL